MRLLECNDRIEYQFGGLIVHGQKVQPSPKLTPAMETQTLARNARVFANESGARGC
jgi:hypothetical protein